jgi:hypothetical protein
MAVGGESSSPIARLRRCFLAATSFPEIHTIGCDDIGKYTVSFSFVGGSRQVADDSWQYQGRQYHMWFGHGTKPKDDPTVVARSLEENIRAIAGAAIAGLPQNKRYHSSAHFSPEAVKQLTTAVSAWVGSLHLPPAEFAARFFGRDATSPIVEYLREVAMRVASARNYADIRAATDALGAGMLAVGLDRWPRELAELAARADAVRVQNFVHYQMRVTVSDAPYETAAINYDPRHTQLTTEQADIEKRLREIAQRVLDQLGGKIDAVSRPAAGSILHGMFADAVLAAHIPGVRVEQSFAPTGERMEYGEDGSKRTDIILVDPSTKKVIAIWDWKVGNANLSPRRAQELAEYALGSAGKTELAGIIPVREIHIDITIIVQP